MLGFFTRNFFRGGLGLRSDLLCVCVCVCVCVHMCGCGCGCVGGHVERGTGETEIEWGAPGDIKQYLTLFDHTKEGESGESDIYHSKRGYTLSELTQCSHTMLQLCPSYQATSTPSHPTSLLFGRAQETQLNRTVSPTCTRSAYIDYRGSKQWHSIRVYIGPRCIEKDSH